jgi:aminoglycoside phosphotransferase (APT) family kinase protein
MKYLGHLHRNDSLYGYLQYEILPQLGVHGTPDFRVYKIKASNSVYLYEDRRSQARVIGKFFGTNRSPQSASHHMEQEFHNLNSTRGMGFCRYPHYIARPLGYNVNLDCVLVEEFCYGTPLHDLIVNAIQRGGREILFQKLTALAYFLATMHNRTVVNTKVEFGRACSYFDKILKQLEKRGYIGRGESREFYRLKDRWGEKGCMWEDQQVLVHGDVTPTNILFGDGLWVIVVDLERMKLADRVSDLGSVAGELKHFFMQHAGNKALAEPFIGHFLWEYACHFPDRESAFASITRRVPFYMSSNLLRIARNSWVSHEHRRVLLKECKKTLG